MALPRASKRPALAVALVFLAGFLPAGPAQAAPTDPGTLKLQVSPEIGVASESSAPFTATVYGDHPETTVTFHVIDGVAQGFPDQTCKAPASQTVSSCSVSITSNSVGTSQVRAWIGSSPDLTEGRLSSSKATPSGGIIGSLSSDPDADCQPSDDPSNAGGGLGGILGGGGSSDICHTAQNPTTGQPDPETPGTTAEGDGTDVVRMTWTTFTEG
ncbi:MAG TPA: hypothetical protein VHL53_22945, partial [Acidimicrobiia bacterium]|nr:hypothetical protein [Acidimicrobiia bacterium]